MFKAKFDLKEVEKVRVAWQNKGWAKVITAKDWEKVKCQIVKQPNPEENSGFPRHLVIKIEKRQGGW